MKLICVGKNYEKIIDNKANNEPLIFLKPDTAVLIKKQPFFIPDFSNNIHHEVELLVKINRVGKHIDKKFAHKYYNEVGLGIDFTARDLQEQLIAKGMPWDKAKGFDGAAVVGKWLNIENIKDVNALSFSLTVNDEVVQKGNTSNMTYKIDELIEYVSKYFTLKIGDIIFTGTPAGAGKVKPNDKLKGYIENEEMFSITVK